MEIIKGILHIDPSLEYFKPRSVHLGTLNLEEHLTKIYQHGRKLDGKLFLVCSQKYLLPNTRLIIQKIYHRSEKSV